MEKHSQVARQQFQILLERANKRFGKLRELQTRGDHSWPAAQSLFHKTFESFSRLWQFQLNNRSALLETGLQRAELGSIANKIGQLYYNYYLRSGDTNALLESYTFYDAVHTRQYFASTTGFTPDPAAAAQQMRFYARFVVVCLFLHRREEAMQLLQELQASVSSYMLQYSSPDVQEWQLVVNEVAAVMEADQFAMPLPRSPGSLEVPYTPPLRCRLTDPAAACAPHLPRLREAIFVSYRPRQVKVAELPLELFRMAQALEWQRPAPQLPPQQHVLAASGSETLGKPPSTGGAAVPVLQGKGATPLRDTAAEENGGARPSASSSLGLKAPNQASHKPGGAEGIGGGGGRSAAAGSVRPQPSAAEPTVVASQPQRHMPPQQQQQQQQAGPSVRAAPGAVAGPAGRSPPRQLLHRPSAQRLLTALLAVTAGMEQTAADEQFVLLYISADAAPEQLPLGALAGAGAGAGASGGAAAAFGAFGNPATSDADAGPSQGLAPDGVAVAAPRRLLLCPPPHHSPSSFPKQALLSNLSQARQFQLQTPPAATAAATPQQSGSSKCSGLATPSGTTPKVDEAVAVPRLNPMGASSKVGGAVCGGSAVGATATAAAAADGLLSPDELLSVTRRRLLLVLDSDMGGDFARLQGRELGFPLLCIAAPPWQALTSGPDTCPGKGQAGGVSAGPGIGPAGPSDSGRYGSLTAQALTCPAQALCALVGQTDPQSEALQRLQEVLDDTLLQLGQRMAEQLAAATQGSLAPVPSPPPAGALAAQGSDSRTGTELADMNRADPSPGSGDNACPAPATAGASSSCSAALTSSPPPSSSSSSSPPSFAAWAPVFADCLTRRLLLHFALYRACVHMHPRRNCNPAMVPKCFPPLPPAADATSDVLQQGVLRAAEVLGRPGIFSGRK
ncbi:hypothetical protein VaNZ11_011941 [Volvox africanus]|uniref:Uncharacterized protein n=1 Tax=Volvox africanus TaxID=51714 RepID=A0ABQ5SD17_9CHLO|nr:hypothetical protein VaNZ11_011941 [Volvox africanus]